jgi:DNA repair protein RecN (Recombination protein N)
MLSVVRIKNLAIVEELEIEFGSGLNVLTGETGAGKSIILKAIELLTGKRVSSDIVRSGAEQCTVEGLFILNPATQEQLAQLSDEADELSASDDLIIRRVIDKSGRSKVYVNGNMSTAALLQTITVPLLDITGQHEHQRLVNPSEHLSFLDQYGVPEELRAQTAAAYGVYAKAAKALELFQKNSQERTFYYERIKDELKELEQAALQEGERAELEAELKRLANYETLSTNINSCLMLIEDDETGIETKLRKLLLVLSQSAALDGKLEEARSLVDAASAQLTEARIGLADYGSALEFEPGRLEFLRERIAEIARLERKYRKSVADIVSYQEQIKEEIAAIESEGFDERKLVENLAAAEAILRKHEAELSAERRGAAQLLAKAVEEELGQLNMKRARFKVEILPANSSARGADVVQFMLAANPGEPELPLAKVASGGELSRILLVLKTLLNKQISPATQIFDEIDSGIGGVVAQVVGEKLKRVSQSAQVILVTHAPQIAAFADAHFTISKTSTDTRTSTQIEQLSDTTRVRHIASMLAGKQVTANFEDSARELLAQATAFKGKANSQKQAKALRKTPV